MSDNSTFYRSQSIRWSWQHIGRGFKCQATGGQCRKGDSENTSDFRLTMPSCEVMVNDALASAHNSKYHNRSDSIPIVSDNYSRFRAPSADLTGYGAATSRSFTIYENFSGKIVSVLLEYNFLFSLVLHS